MLLINSFEGSFFPSNDSFKPLLFFFLDPIRASEIGHLIIKKTFFEDRVSRILYWPWTHYVA